MHACMHEGRKKESKEESERGRMKEGSERIKDEREEEWDNRWCSNNYDTATAEDRCVGELMMAKMHMTKMTMATTTTKTHH